jgi:hypothetical protein
LLPSQRWRWKHSRWPTRQTQPQSLLVANPIDRCLLNSTMLSQFKRDEDGGLTLHVQNESPGTD